MKWIIFSILAVFIIAGGYFFIRVNPQILKNIPGNASPADKIRIANIGEYSIFNLIAEKKGYFKDNNLETQIIEYPSGPPAVADLLAAKVDFAVAADFVGVRNIFTSNDLRILAEVSKHEDFSIVWRKGGGIINVKDLKGKKIGVTKKGVGEFFLLQFLTANNVHAKDAQIVDLSPAEAVSQFKEGKIDAVVVFNPYVHALKKMLGENAVIWPVQNNQKVFALLYGTDSFLKDHQDVARRYVRALLKAEKFLKENDAEARAILAEKMKYGSEYIDYIWSKFDFTIGLDQSLLLSMEDQARFAIDSKLADKSQVPNYLDYIYFDALQNNEPDRISMIR